MNLELYFNRVGGNEDFDYEINPFEFSSKEDFKKSVAKMLESESGEIEWHIDEIPTFIQFFGFIDEDGVDDSFFYLKMAIDNQNLNVEALESFFHLEGGKKGDFDDFVDKFKKSYQGVFKDDADFAYNEVEDSIPSNSYIEIDWDKTTDAVMQDFLEYDNHYFKK